MTILTKRTVKLLAFTVEVAKTQLPDEAQKMFEVYQDPDVSPEAKEKAIKEVDKLIEKLEKKVETERMILPERKARNGFPGRGERPRQGRNPEISAELRRDRGRRLLPDRRPEGHVQGVGHGKGERPDHPHTVRAWGLHVMILIFVAVGAAAFHDKVLTVLTSFLPKKSPPSGGDGRSGGSS